MFKKKLGQLFCILLTLVISTPAFALPAFPGAQGHGANTVGGRGGTVYKVTNLNNSGTGSLRACMEASGPRTCVFTTGGTITLTSGITVRNPFITVAGQTAPGGGITIRGGGVLVQTHDVVMRYLTIRRGPGGDNHSLEVQDNGSSNVYNVVIDHCSLSWATDENFATQYGARDITAQWNLVSEGLYCSTHSEGCHSMGAMFGGRYFDEGHSKGGGYNVTVHHNLFALNKERNPLFDLVGTGQSINNVSYGMNSRSHMFYDRGEFTAAKYNVIKNYTKKAPWASSPYTGQVWKYTPNSISWGMYFEGNIDSYRTSDSQAQNLSVESGSRGYLVGSRYPAPAITETSAAQAYTDVLNAGGAGNSKYVTCSGAWANRRDSHDTRVVGHVMNGTGAIINDPSEVGGYLTISAGGPCADADNDGMPDLWEVAVGLNPNDASDALLDSNGDGYTNLEKYLNGTNPKAAGGGGGGETQLSPPTGLRVVQS